MVLAGRKAARGAIALVAVFGMFAVACGGNSDKGNESGSTTSLGSDGSEGSRDGVVKVGYDLVQSGGFTLDPGSLRAGPTMDALYAVVYGRLLRQTADGSLVPGLAERATVIDANTIEVDLHPNMTWQDGTPFDAQSVKDGLNYSIDSGNQAGLGSGFYSLTSIDVVGATVAQLNFTDGTAASWFDTYISSIEATIVKPGSDFSKPVGAGPMQIASVNPGQEMELQRFNGYWEADKVGFAGMKLIQTDAAQPQASTSALRSGQIDVATLDVTQSQALSGDLAPVTVTDPESLIRLLPCKNQAPFDDVRIRTALNKAVDRDAISEAVFAGTATPAVELWPEGNRFFTEDVADDLAYDPDGAKKLIEEAGSPEVSFLLFSLNGLSLPEVAQVLEQEFAAVGLKAELTISNQLVDQFLAPQAAGAALFPGTPNSGLEKLQDYSGDSLGNVCKYNNSELDGLIAQLSRVSESTDQAVALWDQINTLFANEALGVNLVFSSNLGGYNQSRLTMNSTFPGGLVVFPDIFDSHMNS